MNTEQTYHYHGVMVVGQEKLYAYIGDGSYQFGDFVRIPFGKENEEKTGVILNELDCDDEHAPYPVKRTKSIIRKTTAEESAEIRKEIQELRKQADQKWLCLPGEDDIKRDENGQILGYKPVYADKVLVKSGEKLDYTCYCGFRFKGPNREIKKMATFLVKNKIRGARIKVVNKDVAEIRIRAGENTPMLIKEFPALRATGIAEKWGGGMAYVLYSESGYSTVTESEFVGYVDAHAMVRWTYECDMYEKEVEEPYKTEFTWGQTGDVGSVEYSYPYQRLWNSEEFAILTDDAIIPEDLPDDTITQEDLPEKELETVVIPEGTEEIPSEKFKDHTLLEEVVLPESLKKIGSSAFEGCTSLKKVVMPRELEEIEQSAFKGCVLLEELEMPQNLKKIDAEAFWWCENLRDITLPESLTWIGHSAFVGCRSLREITLPEGIQTITGHVFSGCVNLKKVTLPESVTSITISAFRDCKNLQEINLPESVTSIGEGAFYGCEALTEIRLPSKVVELLGSSWGWGVFARCINLKKVILSEQTKTIGEYAFYNCEKLSEITLPEGLKKIGKGAFEDCKNLKEISIPGGVKTIWTNVFKGCTKLETVTIQRGVERISKAFGNCRKLKNVYVYADLKKELAATVFYKTKDLTIYGLPGTAIERYARGKGIAFKSIDPKRPKSIAPAEDIKAPSAVQEELVVINDSLAGKTFVVTGDVEHFASRAKLKEFIMQRGGKLTGSVSGKTDYLICNEQVGSTKLWEAEDRGVPIITEEEFLEMVGEEDIK